MFIQVRLLNGFTQSLWYEVPISWPKTSLYNALVKVPLKNKMVLAFVQEVVHEKPEVSWDIRKAFSIEPLPNDARYQLFISQLSDYYLLESYYLFQRLRSFLETHQKTEIKISSGIEALCHAVKLTEEQQIVTDFVAHQMQQSVYAPVLLHGVTGSGKSEVYRALIETALMQKKTVIFLVPEVSLAVQFTNWFKHRLIQDQVFGFHSATSAKDKKSLWQALLQEVPLLIIGVHLPILLPISNLGLIIVDEEHDVGYQEKKHPRINSNRAALIRARAYNIPILLGSATPSLNSLHNVSARNWKFFQLKQRFAGKFPEIRCVNLLDKKRRAEFWISKQLQEAIALRLEKKEQTILFLNRRGFSFFVLCSQCGFIFKCINCSVSLTLHENDRLLCHYCACEQQLTAHCPSCKTDASAFLKKGIGTQQLVSIVQRLFKQARIERADVDSTVNKKKWQATLNKFCDGQIDILIGTQTITKGYHFPNVTLVGIIWADLQLNFPVYTASEVALQQLIQVAGRAGREKKESLVIAQTMNDHPIFEFINESSYLEFCKNETEIRKEFNYPPNCRFAELELTHADACILQEESEAIRHSLQEIVDQNKLKVTILGPAKPPVHLIKNVNVRKIYFKSESSKAVGALVTTLNHAEYRCKIFFNPDS